MAAAVAAEAAGGPGMPEAAGDLAAGLALLGGGMAVWAARARSACARIMVLAGAAWFAGDVWGELFYLHRGPLVHLLLSYPTGRVRRGPVAAVIAAAYVDGAVPAIARAEWPTLVLTAAVVVTAALRHSAATGAERRPRAVALGAAAAVGAPLALAAVGRLAEAGTGAVALWAYYAAVALTGVTMAADLLWGHWTRVAVTELVVDLGDRPERQAVREALARTLGDPRLEIGYRVAASDGWVDELGRPFDLSSADPGRRVTLVRDDGASVAALVHDPAALRDEELAASVAAAVRLAVVNLRIQAEVAARVREVAASGRRLVEAADEERRQLADELRAGPERRLLALSNRLSGLAAARDGATADDLQRLTAELDAARDNLLRFAQGVHPRALTKLGLGAALAQLGASAAVPVTLSVTDRRFPPAQEAAAFFVCSEGLANVAKYASATRVHVSVTTDGSRLVLRVSDDGAGGADPSRGSGLRGLVDRVEALGGSLRVDSPPGGGTLLEAELPISPADVS